MGMAGHMKDAEMPAGLMGKIVVASRTASQFSHNLWENCRYRSEPLCASDFSGGFSPGFEPSTCRVRQVENGSSWSLTLEQNRQSRRHRAVIAVKRTKL